MIPEQTERDPYARVKHFDEEKPKKFSNEELKAIENRLKEYKIFRDSPMGRDSLAIASAEIVRLQSFICSPFEAFLEKRQGLLMVDAVHEMRAQARGALSVWLKILHEPEFLVSRRVELEQKNKNKP